MLHNWDTTLSYSLMKRCESTLDKIHEHNFREFNVFYFSKWLNIYKIVSFFPYVFYNLYCKALCSDDKVKNLGHSYSQIPLSTLAPCYFLSISSGNEEGQIRPFLKLLNVFFLNSVDRNVEEGEV